MAKKLQHFNTIEEYKAFLRSDDFVPPDISTIGTGSPNTWDVEYNPENMLLIADKKIFEPNDSVLNYTVLSITNGRSNVWWRPSTGGTYTKISNSDLPFYSGYTIGKTDLSVAMPERTTSYNNEYIISAISDASTSITVSTTSKQYGLMELTPPPTFKWEGETLTAQVKTAPGNEWEITNIPSWLTFSQTTGVGPTSISVTAEETHETTERTGVVTIGYTNSAVTSYTVTSEFKQEKRNGVYFVFNTDLVNIDSGETNNYPIGYTASGDGEGVQVVLQTDATWITFVNNPFTSSTSGNITINVGANPNRNNREAIVSAIIGGQVIDTVQVTQYGHELYFYISSSSTAEALSTSANTLSFVINSADTNNRIVYYATNYTPEEIESLTFDTSSFICGDTTTMTTAGTFTFNMKAKTIVIGNTASTTTPILKVISGSSAISTVNITHDAAAYFGFEQLSVTGITDTGATLTNNIQTNISNSELSLTSLPSIPSYTFNGTYLEYTIPANTSAVSGVNYTLTAKWGTNNLQSFTVQQNQKTATFALLPTSTDVTNSAYTGYVSLSTNVSDSEIPSFNLSVSSDVSWLTITGSSLVNNGHIDFNVSENTSTDERTATITLYSNGTSVSTASVKQAGAIPKYIYITSEGQTSESYSVNSGGTNSKSYVIITNYEQSQLDAMTKNKPDWVNNLSLTTSNVSFGVSAQAIGASSRSGDITFGGIIITVQQEKGEDFYMNVTTPSSIPATATSFDISVTTNSSKQYTIYVNSTPYTSATGNFTTTYTCGENTGITQRTYTVSASNEDITSNTSTVTQNGLAESVILYLNGTNGNITIGSGATSFIVKVVPSANDFQYDILVSGATWKSGLTGTSEYTYTCGDNPETTARTFTIEAVSTNASEQFTVTQSAKAYLWIISTGQTTASTTNIVSGGTSLSYNILTNYSQEELDAFTVTKPDWINTVKLTKSSSALTFNVDQNPIASEARSGNVLVGGLTVSLSQNAGEPFVPNLKVNNSTTPGAIGSAVTSFTITTEPNSLTKQYTIYVGSTEITTTAGTYSYVYNCGENPNTSERTFTVTCEGESVSITQEAKHLSFIWNDTTTSATTETVEKDITASTKYFTTNYENLSVSYIGHITGATINGNGVTAYYPVNTGITQQEGTVEVKSNGVTIGTYAIKQNGTAESVTLYLNGTHNSITIGSGATSFIVKVVPSANDFQYDILVSGATWKNDVTGTIEDTYTCPANPETTARTFTVKAVSTNASDELTVTQNAKAYFLWEGGSTAITETVGSAVTSSSKNYTTNYTGLTTSTGGCVTGATINENSVTAKYKANPDTSDRTGYVNIMNGSTVVGTYNITQNAKAYLWIISTGQTTASTTNITSAGTSLNYNILTNYLQSELDGFSVTKPDWVNTVKLTKSTLKLTFNVDQNPIASEARSGNVLVGGLTVSLSQNAGAPFVPNLKVNEDTGTTTISWDSDEFTITTEPNDKSKEYIIYVNDSPITASGDYEQVYHCGENTGTTSRTFTVRCSTEIVTVTQDAKPGFTPNLKVNGNIGNVIIRSSESAFTITTVPNVSLYTYAIYVNDTAITTTTGSYSGNYTCGINSSSASEQTYIVRCSGETVNVTQYAKLVPNLKVNGSSTNITIEYDDDTVTFSTEPNTAYRGDYTIYVNGSSFITTTGSYSGSYDWGVNPGQVSRDMTISVWDGPTKVQEIEITQKPQPFMSNLMVNGSTSPNNIGSGTTGFTITTQPNFSSQSYNIYVNDTLVSSTTGNFTGVYNCGENTGTTERTFIVKTVGTGYVETVSITQDAKPAPQTRTILVHGTDAYNNWEVSNTKSIFNETDIIFVLGYYDGGETLEGEVFIYDNPQTENFPMGSGYLTIETENTSAFNLTLKLKIDADGDKFKFTPNINPLGFGTGTAGGSDTYESTGTISIPAGSVGSTTDVYLGKTTWDLTAP